MSDTNQWYYVQAGTQHGPVGTEQMRALLSARTIDRDTLIWSPAMTGWQPLGQTELASLAGNPPPLGAQPSFGAPFGAPNAGPAAGLGNPGFGAPTYAGPAAAPATYPYNAGGGAGSYGVSPGFVDAIKICFGKYVTWAGRATRSEYWWFVLFYVVAVGVATALDVMFLGGSSSTDYSNGVSVNFSGTILSSLTTLILFLPMLSVAIRRLHDTDRSGWWYWILLVPFVGVILFIVWLCTRGTPGPNRYG